MKSRALRLFGLIRRARLVRSAALAYRAGPVCRLGLAVLLVRGCPLLLITPALGHAQAPQPQAGLPSAPPPAAPAQSATDKDYVIGPGDIVQVFVWRNPDLTATVPVRPDGRITTPLVPDMVASGKTPAQLARDVEKVLSEYVRSPQVNIIVTQPADAFSQVKITGHVKRPGSVPYHKGMTVLDAILAAGGLDPFAAGNRAKLVRSIDGKETETRVKLDKLLNDGDLKQNLPLRPGDIIVVPESLF